MKKHLFPFVGCLAMLLLVFAVSHAAQKQRGPTTTNSATSQQGIPAVAVVTPHIDSVSQGFPTNAVDLILTGTHFPAKVSNGVWTNIRLTPTGGGETFYAGGTGNWSSTRIDDFLSFNTIAGRRYKIGLIQYSGTNPARKTLVSNEVEYLLLMNLVSHSPGRVTTGTTEIEVSTANDLGSQGAKIVKLGGRNAAVTQWGGGAPNGGKFKIRIPRDLTWPGTHDLSVEENGVAVSDKLQIRLEKLGIK